jgi:hypothetical protein
VSELVIKFKRSGWNIVICKGQGGKNDASSHPQQSSSRSLDKNVDEFISIAGIFALTNDE